MRATFPDIRYTADDVFEADGRVVVRWTASGIQSGTLWGSIPPTGRGATWRGINVVTVTDGRISEVWAVSNMAAIGSHLGLELRIAPAPGDNPVKSAPHGD